MFLITDDIGGIWENYIQKQIEENLWISTVEGIDIEMEGERLACESLVMFRSQLMVMESKMHIHDFENRSLIKVRDMASWSRVVKALVESGATLDLSAVVQSIRRRKVG